MENPNTIFVWRADWELWDSDPHFHTETCPCCTSEVVVEQRDYVYRDAFPFHKRKAGSSVGNYTCPLCGWCREKHYLWDRESELYEARVSALKSFDINSSEVALKELGTHLRRRFSDIYSLSWRRFEELIADVFAAHGMDVVLTQETRDGGADILLYRRSRKLYGIVECKKYADTRKVGVTPVRTLVGAAVDWNTRRAVLVTSSDFSSVARSKALDYLRKGYDIDLVAASDLLRLLEVYNERLLPLHLLTQEDRERIIRSNKRGVV